jgi:hypothetical protein
MFTAENDREEDSPQRALRAQRERQRSREKSFRQDNGMRQDEIHGADF